MNLKIRIDDEVYNHFLSNKYSRADIIAVHTALNTAKVYKPYERMLPCTCGCKQREHWRCVNPKDGNPNILVCKKCGKQASGKSEADAKRNWNKMIKEKIEYES